MLKTIYRVLIELTNGRWSSFILKRFSQSSLSKYVVSSFAKTYKINTNEMLMGIHDYPTLHEFFIRELKKGARPINEEELSVVSPVDAVIEDIGVIHPDSTIIVKNKSYSISEMLGSDEKAAHYLNGTYMIFYLSPSHYHRIHAPVSGKIIEQWVLGKKSYPVNKMGLKYGRKTLSKNYRSISEIEVKGSHFALVKVGAMFVNSIELTHQDDYVIKGSEMAYFTFGSTVILLFQEKQMSLLPSIKAPYHIKLGEKIGVMNS
ncbi:phosphatidylserine decarboxylase [Bacillus sp. CGMCC 1.16607]|uniref:phosphatidylserine decarboxylase n=1 Tax=Bacillus sp. CGMCC 1.16607 TaxID=3351842 RepID=UPI00362BE076